MQDGDGPRPDDRRGVGVTRDLACLLRSRMANQRVRRTRGSGRLDVPEDHGTVNLDKAILSSLPGNIAVVDRRGAIIQVNEAWERFAVQNGAVSLEAVSVGANYLEACQRASARGSDNAAAAIAGLSSVLQGIQREFRLEYPCHSPHVRRWYLLMAAALAVDSGGAVCTHIEITDRVMAQQDLARTSAFFRALIENTLDVVTIIDNKGIIRYESPSIKRVLGYSQDELIGRSPLDLTHPEDVSNIRQVLDRLRQRGMTSAPVEFSFRHKDGGWRILEGVAKHAVEDPAVGGIVVTSRDVTDRRRAELELREKEAALRSSHRALQAVTARLLEAEETERRRLSRELHDDLNQRLAALAMEAGSIAKTLPPSGPVELRNHLRALQSDLTDISGQVRSMAYHLHPSILDDLGVVVAVRSFCADFTRREGIKVRFTHRGVVESLDHQVSSTVYRITQEALRNVARHSGAKTASVCLSASVDAITLRVADTGCGFDVKAAHAQPGLGLTSMGERARLLGGTFDVTSRIGSGSIIRVHIPRVRQEV